MKQKEGSAGVLSPHLASPMLTPVLSPCPWGRVSRAHPEALVQFPTLYSCVCVDSQLGF